MEYKRFGDTILLRVNRGEELMETIRAVCLEENIKLGIVSGIGGSNRIEYGLYSAETKTYIPHIATGDMEITSIVGNVTTMAGNYYSHVHVTACGEEGNVIGGHLEKAEISVTAEVFIQIIEGIVDRKLDSEIGINLIEV